MISIAFLFILQLVFLLPERFLLKVYTPNDMLTPKKIGYKAALIEASTLL
jgi:hypothetical protein